MKIALALIRKEGENFGIFFQYIRLIIEEKLMIYIVFLAENLIILDIFEL